MNGLQSFQKLEQLNHMQPFRFWNKAWLSSNKPISKQELKTKKLIEVEDKNENFYSRERLIEFLNRCKSPLHYKSFALLLYLHSLVCEKVKH